MTQYRIVGQYGEDLTITASGIREALDAFRDRFHSDYAHVYRAARFIGTYQLR